MNKYLLTCLLAMVAFVQANAVPDFSSTKKYHIVCQLFPDGCVVDGLTRASLLPPATAIGLSTRRARDDTAYRTLRRRGTSPTMAYTRVRVAGMSA